MLSEQFSRAIINNTTNIYFQCTNEIHSKPQKDSDAALRFNHTTFFFEQNTFIFHEFASLSFN